jgi:hypothetical protein
MSAMDSRSMTLGDWFYLKAYCTANERKAYAEVSKLEHAGLKGMNFGIWRFGILSGAA